MKKPVHNKHKPTAETKAAVASLCSYGITREEICNYIGVSDKTLNVHYKEILATAHIKATAAVARRLYKKAVEEGDNVCMIFWLKTRAKWRETDSKELLEDNIEIKEKLLKLEIELDKKHKKDY